MDEKALEFWRRHSVNFIEMALAEEKRERLLHADGYGKSTRECGDTLEIFLTSRNGNINSASFHTEGCIYTVACANTLVRMIEGKPAQDAWAITPRQIVEFLETMPEKEYHCAELAVRALRLALVDLNETNRQPWVKFYRKTV
jgi:nitrogen fixation protein NifU and related proteins